MKERRYRKHATIKINVRLKFGTRVETLKKGNFPHVAAERVSPPLFFLEIALPWLSFTCLYWTVLVYGSWPTCYWLFFTALVVHSYLWESGTLGLPCWPKEVPLCRPHPAAWEVLPCCTLAFGGWD